MSDQVVHAVEGLCAETVDGPRLLGTKCASCGTGYFPRSSACRNPDCDESKIEDATFGPSGTLWSYCVQNYAPPAPTSSKTSRRGERPSTCSTRPKP